MYIHGIKYSVKYDREETHTNYVDGCYEGEKRKTKGDRKE